MGWQHQGGHAAGEPGGERGLRRLPAQPGACVTASKFFQARAVKDFREILADKSIDVVCISTPDTGTPT